MTESLDALETIDLLYQAAIDPSLWPEALDRLARASGGIGTAMIPITPQDTAGLVVSPALQEANVEYEREWWRHDTRVLRIFSRKLKGGVCCEAELFTDEEVARDPLRQEFLRSWGIGAFAAQLATPLPNFVVAFSVQRALDRGHFDKRELKTLDLLGRHAARALVISMQIAAARGIERTLAAALSLIECAAFVVDRGGNLIFANDAAKPMVGDGLCIDRGRLRVSSRAHQRPFARLMRSVLREGASGGALEPIALPRPSGRWPLIVQAMPIASDGGKIGLPLGAAALVIVVDPERSREENPERELRLLGLTASEARLAALIGKGLSRAEAAGALNLSPATVSDTVKHIYSKLDIKRQSELVRLIDRLTVLVSWRKDGTGSLVLACMALLTEASDLATTASCVLCLA